MTDLFILRWLSRPYTGEKWENIIGKFDVLLVKRSRWSGVHWILEHTHRVGRIRGAHHWRGEPRFGLPLWDIVAKAERRGAAIEWWFQPIQASAGPGKFTIVDVADGHNTVGAVIAPVPLPHAEEVPV